MANTATKRIKIISIYILLLFLIGFWIYFRTRPQETCSDGIKNQNEQGVDCGGICPVQCEIKTQDLVVAETGLVPSGLAGKYDFYTKIENPNAIFGSGEFLYVVEVKDSSGQIVAERNGTSFILPSEKKYVIENNIELDIPDPAVDFKIIEINWTQFNDYYEKPDIQIVNKNYNEISGGTERSEAVGLLKNKSPFDFSIIKISILLEDENGNIIATNSTQMKAVKSGENREFKVSWPNVFSGRATNMKAQAEVNVFDSDAFLKQYYETEKFQQY